MVYYFHLIELCCTCYLPCHAGCDSATLVPDCTTLDMHHSDFYFVSTTESPPLELVNYTDAQVQAALDQLRSVPAYVEVLLLKQQPQKKGERPVTPDPTPQEEAGQKLIDTSVADGASIEGAPDADPGLFEESREMDLDCNQVYGLANMEDLQRVSLYTSSYCKLTPKALQSRGACLFVSVRRNCTAPL